MTPLYREKFRSQRKRGFETSVRSYKNPTFSGTKATFLVQIQNGTGSHFTLDVSWSGVTNGYSGTASSTIDTARGRGPIPISTHHRETDYMIDPDTVTPNGKPLWLRHDTNAGVWVNGSPSETDHLRYGNYSGVGGVIKTSLLPADLTPGQPANPGVTKASKPEFRPGYPDGANFKWQDAPDAPVVPNVPVPEATITMPEVPALRAAHAAKMIYDRELTEEFGLRLLNEAEMKDLKIPNDVIKLLKDANPVTGFGAGIYEDTLTGKYILAFKGTNKLGDVVTDIYQGTGFDPLGHYTTAMNIANGLKDVKEFKNGNLIITGHSLGGGLAGIAACASGFKAITFNAAGVHLNTILSSFSWNTLVRYMNASKSELVTAYYTGNDPLSFSQDYLLLPWQIKLHRHRASLAWWKNDANSIGSLLMT